MCILITTSSGHWQESLVVFLIFFVGKPFECTTNRISSQYLVFPHFFHNGLLLCYTLFPACCWTFLCYTHRGIQKKHLTLPFAFLLIYRPVLDGRKFKSESASFFWASLYCTLMCTRTYTERSPRRPPLKKLIYVLC